MLNKEFVKSIVGEIRNMLPNMVVEAKDCVKNNDVTLHGIMIRDPGSYVNPVFYIEHYLGKYEEEDYMQCVGRIAEDIVNTYRNTELTRHEFGNVNEIIKDFNNVKPMLRIRLINKENNAKLLQDIPYMTFLDMAIIATIELDTTSQEVGATIKVNNKMLSMWKLSSLTSILPIATENTFKTKYSLTSMADILSELTGLPKEMLEDAPIKMYVLTNETKNYGATEICNYNTMKEIADLLQSDLIVLPSSIHETIIVPKEEDMDIEELTQMVRDVNGSEVATNEVLSDHAYVFSRENGWEY